MNGNRLLLDTNIILYLLNGDETLAELLNEKQLYISIITELELLAFKGITAKEEKVVNEFVSQCKTINITSEVKQNTIKIRKKYNTKLPDSIIMATAQYLELPLVTSDAEFKKVDNLILLYYEN